MYKTERTYDLAEIARQNLHIHTTFSPCAKPENIAVDIVREAEKDNLTVISFTDHYNSTDYELLANNQELRRQVEAYGTKVKVLYSAELSAYGVGKFLDSIELNRQVDYRLYAYNHFHMPYWEHPEDKSARGYVAHSIAVLESLFATERADCVCHPFIGRFIKALEDRTEVTRAITDNELGDILLKGKNAEVAWELNVPAILSDPAFSKRYWNIGKEVGVTFNIGTDAHTLAPIGTTQFLDQLKEVLN